MNIITTVGMIPLGCLVMVGRNTLHCALVIVLVCNSLKITASNTNSKAGNQLEWNLVMAVCDIMGNLVTIDWVEMFNFGQDYTAAQNIRLVPPAHPSKQEIWILQSLPGPPMTLEHTLPPLSCQMQTQQYQVIQS